jgi:6-phosphogluconolactonase (cycloisomerase 2 family)
MALVIAAACAALGGCGGGSSAPSSPPSSSPTTGGTTASYAVGGSVSGLLNGETVQLLNNNGDALPVSANGSFTFPTALAAGSAYNVTVGTQPAGASCSVSSGSGTISGAVSNVAVTCSPVLMKNIALFLDATTGTLQPYSYDVASGQLSALPAAPKGPGQTANAVLIDASATHAYTLGENSAKATQIWSYTIGAGGVITANGAPLTLSVPSGVSLALDKSGQYLYALGSPSLTGTSIVTYKVNASTGQLGLSGTYAMPSGQPVQLYASPTAEVLYALDPVAATISTFSIATTGNVNPAGNPIATGNDPRAMAMTSDGNYAYVVNATGATVSIYAVAADGTLSDATTPTATVNVPGITTAPGAQPVSIAIDPSNHYLYVGDIGDQLIYQFQIDPTTGALKLLPTPTIASDAVPDRLSIVGDSTTGTVLYATDTASGAVSAWTVNSATGQLSGSKLSSVTVNAGQEIAGTAFGH